MLGQTDFSVTEVGIEELESADKQSVEAVGTFADTMLTQETVNRYLDENVLGTSVKALYADVLRPFIDFLREQTEYYKVDMVLKYAESSESAVK